MHAYLNLDEGYIMKVDVNLATATANQNLGVAVHDTEKGRSKVGKETES